MRHCPLVKFKPSPPGILPRMTVRIGLYLTRVLLSVFGLRVLPFMQRLADYADKVYVDIIKHK